MLNERMGRFNVWLYRNTQGDSPVVDFINHANMVQKGKIIKQILHLSEFGITIHNSSLKKLTGTPLWEVRILGRDNIRLFCANTIFGVSVLHIFIKKSQKTPASGISVAVKRLRSLT